MIQESTTAAESTAAGTGQLAEHYQALAGTLKQLSNVKGDSLQAVGVTSSSSGEGVSTVAFNLAAAATHDYEQPVLLVDANFAWPSVHTAFGLHERTGLADLVHDAGQPLELVQTTHVPNLFVLPAGTATACAQAKLDAAAAQAILESLAGNFGLIVFDMPPSASAASLPLAAALDGMILVVEAERVRSQAAQQMKRRLQQADVHLLGVVFNKRPAHVPEWLYRRL